MTLPATLSITSATVALLAALLALGTSSAPGWRDLRWFAVCAVCGAFFNLANAPATLSTVADGTLLVTSRLSILFAGLHAVSWFMYLAVRERRELSRLEHTLIAVGVAFSFLALVPGVLVEDRLVPRAVDALGVVYRDSPPTKLGTVATVVFVAIVGGLFVRAVRRWAGERTQRAKNPGARASRAVAIALGAVTFGGIHDALASADVIRSPYLLDVSQLVMVLAVGGSIAASFVASARALDASSRALEATQAQLVAQERLAALGELSAVVAHEVRNPLAIVFNAIANLKRAEPASKEHGENVEILQEEAERLRDIVSDLLEFASPRPALLAPESLDAIVESAIAAARKATGAAESETELVLLTKNTRIECDERLVRQAIVNLVTNALQAGGRKGPVQTTIEEDATHLAVRVEDDGDGVPEDLRERIFTPFFSTRPRGTGLGLVVVRRCADAHGGEVSFRERDERGACFQLRLPRERRHEPR